jgi:hypothetical protein
MIKSIKVKFSRPALLLIFFALLCCLVACGGSKDTATGTTTTTTNLSSLTLSLTKVSDGTTATSVSAGSPVQLTAVVIDIDGSPVVNKTVTFTAVTVGLITFNGTPDTGSALTNSSGIATIIIYAAAGVTSGATDINATVTGATANTISGSTGIDVATLNLHLSALTVTPGTISAGGSAAVSITVLDSSNNPYTSSIPVSFTSSGVGATITDQAYTVNGIASATYTDTSYAGTDTITATLTGTTITQTGNITVTPATAGSIIFVSATPTNISLPNTGGAITSTVVFKVLDAVGNPLSKLVDFTLSTTTGNITINPTSTQSDGSTGLVQTIVTAGTVSTPVRVLATIHGTTLTSTSSQLVISTGLPTQKGFDLSATVLSMEGWNYSLTTSTVNAALVDRFQNPVPDGTAVYFTASGGSIDPSCVTTGGACSVTFRGEEPRPRLTDPNPKPAKNGRVVILAYAIGEESFTDLTGSGTFNHLTDPFTDMPDPWVDVNEDGIFDQSEPFKDTYNRGSYSVADGCFNGVLRDYISSDSCYSSPKSIYVRRSLTIVLSSSDTLITVNNGNPITFVCGSGTPVTVPVLVTDVNTNIMPINTTISFATSAGTIISPTSFTVGNGSPMNPGHYNVMLQPDASSTCTGSDTTGIFSVTVTTPDPVAIPTGSYIVVTETHP